MVPNLADASTIPIFVRGYDRTEFVCLFENDKHEKSEFSVDS